MPASTICEPPIQSKSAKHKGSYLPSPVDSEGEEREPDELFITVSKSLSSYFFHRSFYRCPHFIDCRVPQFRSIILA
jgi:hypothetical protein